MSQIAKGEIEFIRWRLRAIERLDRKLGCGIEAYNCGVLKPQ